MKFTLEFVFLVIVSATGTHAMSTCELQWLLSYINETEVAKEFGFWFGCFGALVRVVSNIF
jgi:hypothetical protein